jgi:hypothetical protein
VLHIYDQILARRNALEDAAKAHKLMHAALREKMQEDCPHLLVPGASSCSLCLKVLQEDRQEDVYPVWVNSLPWMWGEEKRDQ